MSSDSDNPLTDCHIHQTLPVSVCYLFTEHAERRQRSAHLFATATDRICCTRCRSIVTLTGTSEATLYVMGTTDRGLCTRAKSFNMGRICQLWATSGIQLPMGEVTSSNSVCSSFTCERLWRRIVSYEIIVLQERQVYRYTRSPKIPM